MSKKRRWTKEEIDYLKQNYNKKSIDDMCSDLGRTKYSILKKAKRLDLTKEINNWTKDELEFLISNWGKYNIKKIAKLLGRSIPSIKKKAFKLKLGPQCIGNGEYLTTGNIGFLLGKNPALIYKWINQDIIKGKPFGKKPIYQVLPEDFIVFLKDYPDKWCACEAKLNFIKPYFYTSTKPDVPNWFKEKVKEDYEKKQKDSIA